MVDLDRPLSIPVEALRELCDPFECVVWHYHLDEPVTREEVAEAILEGNLLKPDPKYQSTFDITRDQHIQRIAWLVVNGWTDPIQVDVGVPSMGTHNGWMVEDGNHRLAAAIYRGDDTIVGEIGGQVSYAVELGLVTEAK